MCLSPGLLCESAECLSQTDKANKLDGGLVEPNSDDVQVACCCFQVKANR